MWTTCQKRAEWRPSTPRKTWVRPPRMIEDTSQTRGWIPWLGRIPLCSRLLKQAEPRSSSPNLVLSKYSWAFRSGNNTSHRQGEDLNEGESRIPEGATCSRERAGNVCCSGAMYETMERVLDELSSSPDFDDNEKSPGIAANVSSLLPFLQPHFIQLVKKEIQQKFGRVFEVVVSNSDFEHASHQVGDLRCKFQSHGLFLMAYETPHQSAVCYSSLSCPDIAFSMIPSLRQKRSTSPRSPTPIPWVHPTSIYPNRERPRNRWSSKTREIEQDFRKDHTVTVENDLVSG